MLQLQEVRKMQQKLGDDASVLPVIFSALSDPGRFRIVRLLMERDDVCVTDVAHVLGITVPAASQQLRILERTGIACKERRGQMMCYRMRSDTAFIKALRKIIHVYS